MEIKLMKNPFRLSKKKTGTMTVQDGKFKMEVKERFRILGLITAVFMFIGLIVAFVFPYILGLIGLIYLVTTSFLAGFLDFLVYLGNWSKRRILWVGKWCIKQPIDDYRYGRKKRKELEDSKVYAK